MARKASLSYAAVELGQDEVEAVSMPEALPPMVGRRQARAGGTDLKSRSVHTMLYLSPEFVRAIRRYALESGDGVKPHDVFLTMLQEGADRRGLNVRARVPSRDRDSSD